MIGKLAVAVLAYFGFVVALARWLTAIRRAGERVDRTTDAQIIPFPGRRHDSAA